MPKYQPYSRRKLKRLRRAWVRRNLKVLVTVTAGIAAVVAVATALIVSASPGPLAWYVLGAVHAGTVVVFVCAVNGMFLAIDRDAILHVRGAWGEENTREELKRAKRKRLIWGSVDSISFDVGDLDHLVVTRRGGLVAIDSKWRNQIGAGGTFDMAKAANKARLRAEALAKTLLRNEPGARHRSRTNPLAVTAVVVVWGALQHEVPDGAKVDGIEFVRGRQLVRWLKQQSGQTVDRDAGEEILGRLDSYRVTAWKGHA